MDHPKNSKWFHERLGPSEGHVHEVRTVLFSKQTPFQRIEIVELGDYGRSLILDGKVQSTQADEFIYHEVLVHPAMLVHPDPKQVMVIGGGGGATPPAGLPPHPGMSSPWRASIPRACAVSRSSPPGSRRARLPHPPRA